MKRLKRPSLLLVLALASLVLLPLLAFWQYRWLGEVSQAERERMQRNLQASAAQFSLEFDRELTRAYLFFQANSAVRIVRPGQPPRPDNALSPQEDIATRYRQWSEAAKHARLVKAIYEARLNAQGAYELARFDPAAGRFEPSVWTDELAVARASLNAAQQPQTTGQQVVQNVVRSRISGSGQGVPRIVQTTITLSALRSLDERLPGLLIPLRPFEPSAFEATPLKFAAQPPCDYRIVLFDLAYLQQQMLPELAQRFLFEQGKDAYTCAVLPSSATQPIYQSDAQQNPTAFAQSDVSVPLFKLRLEEFDQMLMPHLRQQLTNLASHASQRLELLEEKETSTKIEPPSPLAMNEQPLEKQPLLALKTASQGAWRLVVKHRAGSLEAAVNQVRRRNLAISFGVVILLGLSVGLMLLASRRAQALAERQMEFVAGVSHELRTPLAVICSAAENLADGVVNSPAQIKQYGALIRDEGRRLGGMVEQVMEFAGVQSGKRAYEMRSINARAIIDDALNALKVPLAEQGFYVEAGWPPRLPMIEADLASLSRALQNLLTNAMKYSDVSRLITLRAVVVNHTELQFIVEDRGLGIPANELPHLGEAFYRGKAVVAAQIHGNGLGLSLVKQIAQAHGGRLSVESEVGKGSKFTLHLPLPQVVQMQSALDDLTQKLEAR